jgi:hypothetical protein
MKTILTFFLALIAIWPAMLGAQPVTFSQRAGADTFVSSGQPDANFGLMGAMEIAAPTIAQARTENTLLRFDTSTAQSTFDSDFGAGNWKVTSVTLSLFSNVSGAGQQPNNTTFNKIAAGSFEFDLLSDNNWNENSVTWNTLPALLPANNNNNSLFSLGTFSWDAAGEASSIWTLNSDPNLLQEINTGNLVTIFGQPTAGSTVGYLYNTQTLNPGLLNITAELVPEPSALALLAGFLGIMGSSKFYLRKR